MKTVKPSPQMLEFAEDISTKLYERYSGKTVTVSSLADAVRQMIEHKLAQERWTKGNLQVDPARGRSLRFEA